MAAHVRGNRNPAEHHDQAAAKYRNSHAPMLAAATARANGTDGLLRKGFIRRRFDPAYPEGFARRGGSPKDLNVNFKHLIQHKHPDAVAHPLGRSA